MSINTRQAFGLISERDAILALYFLNELKVCRRARAGLDIIPGEERND